jgi:hypothetical protein
VLILERVEGADVVEELSEVVRELFVTVEVVSDDVDVTVLVVRRVPLLLAVIVEEGNEIETLEELLERLEAGKVEDEEFVGVDIVGKTRVLAVGVRDARLVAAKTSETCKSRP